MPTPALGSTESATDTAAGHGGIAGVADLFDAPPGFLDTASSGLPTRTTVAALERALGTWRAGRAKPQDYDQALESCRAAFGRLVDVPTEWVATGSQLSAFAGLVAAGLRDGAEVVAPDCDFTSVLFPFLAQERGGRLRVRLVPLADLADATDGRTSLVAFSAVQSRDGALADLDAICAAAAAHGAQTFCDATQAAGWLPMDARRFDYLACSGYKWLLAPRGTAYLTVRPERVEGLVPVHANWYAGADPWTSIYGGPLRLAASARRFDLSPAWLSWVGGAPAMELLERIGVAAVHEHDVALADRFRAGLGLAPAGSAIVAVEVPDAEERLTRAEVRTAVRNGCVRVSFHLYNDDDDVDRALNALRC